MNAWEFLGSAAGAALVATLVPLVRDWIRAWAEARKVEAEARARAITEAAERDERETTGRHATEGWYRQRIERLEGELVEVRALLAEANRRADVLEDGLREAHADLDRARARAVSLHAENETLRRALRSGDRTPAE